MKRVCLSWTALAVLAACGSNDSVPNPAESLPNRDVPLEDSAQNYTGTPLRADRAGCQTGLGVDSQGRLHVCCTAPTTAEDLADLPISGRERCREEFARVSAACTVSTDQGEKPGDLWACETAESAGTDPSVTADPMIQEDGDEHSLVHVSGASEERKLHATGLLLGKLPQTVYLDLQQKVVGSKYPACNFFLITALCESGYCKTSKPFYIAAEFDTYFFKNGWRLVTLAELKKLFREKAVFDSAFQKDNPVAGRPGHVMVPLGLNADGQVVIAQGNLGTATNEIKVASDTYLTQWQGGFNVFVKQ